MVVWWTKGELQRITIFIFIGCQTEYYKRVSKKALEGDSSQIFTRELEKKGVAQK